MDLSLRPSLIDNIICRPENDGAFLFDPETGNITYMNHSALEVYRLIDGERDINAIFDIFEQRYPEINSVQLKADITSIFDRLDENKFIKT